MAGTRYWIDLISGGSLREEPPKAGIIGACPLPALLCRRAEGSEEERTAPSGGSCRITLRILAAVGIHRTRRRLGHCLFPADAPPAAQTKGDPGDERRRLRGRGGTRGIGSATAAGGPRCGGPPRGPRGAPRRVLPSPTQPISPLSPPHPPPPHPPSPPPPSPPPPPP